MRRLLLRVERNGRGPYNQCTGVSDWFGGHHHPVYGTIPRPTEARDTYATDPMGYGVRHDDTRYAFGDARDLVWWFDPEARDMLRANGFEVAVYEARVMRAYVSGQCVFDATTATMICTYTIDEIVAWCADQIRSYDWKEGHRCACPW